MKNALHSSFAVQVLFIFFSIHFPPLDQSAQYHCILHTHSRARSQPHRRSKLFPDWPEPAPAAARPPSAAAPKNPVSFRAPYEFSVTLTFPNIQNKVEHKRSNLDVKKNPRSSKEREIKILRKISSTEVPFLCSAERAGESAAGAGPPPLAPPAAFHFLFIRR